MQFVVNGPDVPEILLQAHEEGRVVFFCGSGISQKAGLPNFKELVNKIYELCHTSPQGSEIEAFCKGSYETTLDILEKRLPGQRRGLRMRTALFNALQPTLEIEGATETHSALLQLARTHGGVFRLVTTNFDRVFEEVSSNENCPHNKFSAPLLPIPKDSQWDGVVYLHGLLPSDVKDERALDKLVVTSGDFGLAYLTERWASRFVSELFRNFIVCFVGYSTNDPVLRYMLDALAADQLRGESIGKAYIFARCPSDRHTDATINYWKSKGILPILFDSRDNYRLLHDTLKVWAADYRDGVHGKERVVMEYALFNPTKSTKEDDFVGRMLWALSDKSGLPAKHFAIFEPAPPITWLESFCDDRFHHNDLDRFGIVTGTVLDDDLSFSLVNRPAPHKLAPTMTICIDESNRDSKWDEVMFQLTRWLVRHLNDPKLIVWVAQRGGRLHNNFVNLIKAKLDNICDQTPNAPCSNMQTLWRLLLAGRINSTWGASGSLHEWKSRLIQEGVTLPLRTELRELLAPKIVIRQTLKLRSYEDITKAPKEIRELVDWSLVLNTDFARSSLTQFSGGGCRSLLPLLLSDFQWLLEDALDLQKELDEACEQYDRSYLDLPSVCAHPQNRDHPEWVVLIELLRDSWLETFNQNPACARQVIQNWFDKPYPTFKRLAFFAASQDDCIASEIWVKWIMKEDGRWLWSIYTQRETMRLLASQSKHLSPDSFSELESVVLNGPPPISYPEDIEPELRVNINKHSIWLRLVKLYFEGANLSSTARTILQEKTSNSSDWEAERDNERNEFLIWVGSTNDLDLEQLRPKNIAPREKQELVEWLKLPQPKWPLVEDTWSENCRTRLDDCLFALCELSREKIWPTERWSEAFNVWSEERLAVQSWNSAAPLVQKMHEDTLLQIIDSVTLWLKKVSESLIDQEQIFLSLCDRILNLRHQSRFIPTASPVMSAINHPVGRITDALLNFWFLQNPSDDDGLPENVKPLFSIICSGTSEQFCHGRVILASRLIALFRVDKCWTKANLLPFFDWSSDAGEAKAIWEGFLWTPRLYQPVLIEIKEYFLDTANSYENLGEYRKNFARLLTGASLNKIEGFTLLEFSQAIAALPPDGLEAVANSLVKALEGSGEKKEEFWKHRIKPFWNDVWPQSHYKRSNSITKELAYLTLSAGNQFPEVLETVRHWLLKIERPDGFVHKLSESGLCSQFPEDSLKLLDIILSPDSNVHRPFLKNCLVEIKQNSPDICQMPQFDKLNKLTQKYL